MERHARSVALGVIFSLILCASRGAPDDRQGSATDAWWLLRAQDVPSSGRAAVAAQPATEEGPYRGTSLSTELLRRETVRSELRLRDDQREQLGRFLADEDERTAALFADLRQLPTAERRAAMFARREAFRRLGGEMEERALGVLTPRQKQRLSEIRIHELGFAAFINDEVVHQLALTPSQRGGIDRLRREYRSEREQLQSAREERGEDAALPVDTIAELQAKYIEKSLSLLTEEQRQRFLLLRGEPLVPRNP